MSRSLIYGDKNSPIINQLLCDLARMWLGEDVEFGPSMTLGVIENDCAIGVVVFHDFIASRGTMEFTISAQSARWLSRKVIKEIARMGFELNGCHVLFARCEAGNQTTERILTAIGFQNVTLPNMRGKGRDETLFHMTHEAWKQSRYAQ